MSSLLLVEFLGLQVYRCDQPRDEGTDYLAPPRQVRRRSEDNVFNEFREASESRLDEVVADEPAINMAKG